MITYCVDISLDGISDFELDHMRDSRLYNRANGFIRTGVEGWNYVRDCFNDVPDWFFEERDVETDRVGDLVRKMHIMRYIADNGNPRAIVFCDVPGYITFAQFLKVMIASNM